MGIYRFDGSEFVQIPGQLNSIVCCATGTVWGINASGQIYRVDGPQFQQVAGALQSIAVGSDSTVGE